MYKAARSLGFAFAAVYGVAQSRMQLKRLSSSSSILACQGKVKPSDPSARVVGGWPYPLNETAMVATMKWSPPDTRSHAKRVAHGITFLNILSPEANTGHTFTNGSKRLLISWLQSPSPVILEPRKIKSATISTVSPSVSQIGRAHV